MLKGGLRCPANEEALQFDRACGLKQLKQTVRCGWCRNRHYSNINIRISRPQKKIESEPTKPPDHQDSQGRRLYIPAGLTGLTHRLALKELFC